MNRLVIILVALTFVLVKCRTKKCDSPISVLDKYGIQSNKKYCSPSDNYGVCLQLFDNKTFELLTYTSATGLGNFTISNDDTLSLMFNDTIPHFSKDCIKFTPHSIDSIQISLKTTDERYYSHLSIRKDIIDLERSGGVYGKNFVLVEDSIVVSIPYSDSLHFIVQSISGHVPQVAQLFERGKYSIECDRIKGATTFLGSKHSDVFRYHLSGVDNHSYMINDLILSCDN